MDALIACIMAALVGVAVGAGVIAVATRKAHRHRQEEGLAEIERERRRLLGDATREAEAKLKEASLEVKEKMLAARGEFERATRERRGEQQDVERRLVAKEEALDRRQGSIDRREGDLDKQTKDLAGRDEKLRKDEAEIAATLESERLQLERIAGLTVDQAKRELIRGLENEARLEASNLIKRTEDEAREVADSKARHIITMAIQRAASDHVVETTVSVVDLPSDDMKGRIIGREGRNIRALEIATGVDLIVDDTPEAVIISGFDPVRREIARLTLERLIADGRIHPARIEEVVEKVKGELDNKIREEGEAAALALNIPDIHPELIRLLGRLRYRTSYGQNVLQHSKEVGTLASLMAAELKANVKVARRGGLLHDIGKAVDREMEGTHLELGRELLKRYGESPEVIHAMECHHGDYDPRSVEAVLVTAADALSAARPGARREILETYVKRLEKLEAIASGIKGVSKAFAIQAGRELRIIVESAKISDEEALWMSRDVARKIESELQYPGQIKVTVIRETRAIEYAK